MTQAGDLLHLQSIDDDLAGVGTAIAGIDARLARNEEVEDASNALAAATVLASGLQREQRRLEGAIQDLTAKIQPEEKRLYSGAVKSPKELEAIQKEVNHLKERRSSHEEELLGVLDRLESANDELTAASRRHGVVTAAWRTESAALAREREALATRLAAAEAARAVARSAVPPAQLVLYDSLRGRKAGVAVALVRAGTCSGCRVLVPDAVRRRVPTSVTPVQCPNCERILSAAE